MFHFMACANTIDDYMYNQRSFQLQEYHVHYTSVHTLHNNSHTKLCAFLRVRAAHQVQDRHTSSRELGWIIAS